MILVLDNNILVALFADQTAVHGLNAFAKDNNIAQIIIPTPALCEFLAHDSKERISFIQKTKRIASFSSFDEKAAFLTAALAEKYYADRLAIDKQKVKVDLQILGIALANKAKFLLTGDNDFKSYVEKLKLPIQIKRIADLQISQNLLDELK